MFCVLPKPTRLNQKFALSFFHKPIEVDPLIPELIRFKWLSKAGIMIDNSAWEFVAILVVKMGYFDASDISYLEHFLLRSKAQIGI